jgi:hypothetical protein
MRKSALEPDARPELGSVAAVITICAQQKRVKAPVGGTPAGLTIQPQEQVAAAWQKALTELPADVPACDLYAGRAFGLARTAATRAASPLYIISAGLGLVAGDDLAPAYGLTVTKNVAESIASKVAGPFDPVRWFESLMTGNSSAGWDQVGGDGKGRILVALTKPYANMAGPSLAAAPPQMRDRLRIFGANLNRALPKQLHSAVAPYDDRLDAVVPGTRSDFAQRALLHFVEHVAPHPVDRESEFEVVKTLLSGVIVPDRPVRAPRSDAELIILIKGRLRPGASASGLLRQLRDVDGIACEQGRFARLFKAAAADQVFS